MKLRSILVPEAFFSVLSLSVVSAFQSLPISNRCSLVFHSHKVNCHVLRSMKEDTESAFSAFVESMDEEDLFSDEEEENEASTGGNSWQESLEQLLDPTTAAAKRQILLSDLLNSNDKIRSDVQAALRDRKVKIFCIGDCEYPPLELYFFLISYDFTPF